MFVLIIRVQCKKESDSGKRKQVGEIMKMNEAYFRQFDSKYGYDGAVVRGGNSIEVRIMRCLGYFLYGFYYHCQ
jgi:hypothetical protein